MSALIPVGLRRQRMASILLAMAFLVFEAVWFLLLAFLAVLAVRWGLPQAWAYLGACAGGLIANTWGLARSVKNGHFLWLYGRWPADLEGGDRAIDLLHQQARQAFADDDHDKVALLAGKLEAVRRPADLSAGLGRSLALLGRLEEAAAVFRLHGREAESLRWLEPRRAWGRLWPIYFTPGDARWARRHLWLVGLAAASMLGALVAIESSIEMARSGQQEAFDRDGFKASQAGAFTFYYHDPAFRDQVATLAETALEHQLAFLGLAKVSIPPGAFRLYLCETREEYLRRAPFAPSWEQASALPVLNSIYIHRLPDNEAIYFESVLAHELSHLIYHRFFPVEGNDAWLNEGLADYLGYAFALDRAGFARQQWLQQNRFKDLGQRALPFDQFFKVDPHELQTTEDVVTFYRQGFSIVFMLVEHYGREDFLKFLDAYRRSGGDVTAALAKAYPTIKSPQALAAVWSLFYGKAP